MLLSAYLSRRFVTPISRSLQAIREETPGEHPSGISEIDGCSLEEVAARAYISVSTAKKHNTNINRKLGVASREELMLYIDLFRRCGRLDEIAAPQAEDTARCTT